MNDADKIRHRAYEMWLEEGQPEGKHEEHWTRAEQEFARAKTSSDTPGAPPPELENTLA